MEGMNQRQLERILALLQNQGLSLHFSNSESNEEESEEQMREESETEPAPKKIKDKEIYFNSLQFYNSICKYSNLPLSSSLGLQKNIEKLEKAKLDPIVKYNIPHPESQQESQPRSISIDDDSEMKESESESVSQSEMQVHDSSEEVRDYSDSEQIDPPVGVRSKFDIYLPNEEQRKELESVVNLSNKHAITSEMVPNKFVGSIDFDYSRVYNGRFTSNGNLYYCASQDSIGIYNTQDPYNFEHINTIQGRNIRWTISSVDITPDEEKLAYSTLGPIIHIVDLYTLSKFHQAIDLRAGEGGQMSQNNFRVGGCKFSGDGHEIVAGSHCHGIAVYDLEKDYKVVSIKGAHKNDINSVCFANRENSHIIYTASDDCMVKVWDRRILYNNNAIGCFIGHTEGLTYVDSRGDERYLVTAGKDQTLKLWDLRKMNTLEEYRTMGDLSSVMGFDYRMHDYPHPHNPYKHELDNSVCTFTGFECLQTNIRAYFSPQHTTGQRYVYTGSADGSVYIFDILTGENKCYIDSETNTVLRDVAWHPRAPLIASTSFKGVINLFEFDEAQDYVPKNRRTTDNDSRNVRRLFNRFF